MNVTRTIGNGLRERDDQGTWYPPGGSSESIKVKVLEIDEYWLEQFVENKLRLDREQLLKAAREIGKGEELTTILAAVDTVGRLR